MLGLPATNIYRSVSVTQRDVAAALRRLGHGVQLNVPILDGFMCVDLLLTTSWGTCIAVYVDELSELAGFNADSGSSTNTRLRNIVLRRLLAQPLVVSCDFCCRVPCFKSRIRQILKIFTLVYFILQL